MLQFFFISMNLTKLLPLTHSLSQNDFHESNQIAATHSSVLNEEFRSPKGWLRRFGLKNTTFGQYESSYRGNEFAFTHCKMQQDQGITFYSVLVYNVLKKSCECYSVIMTHFSNYLSNSLLCKGQSKHNWKHCLYMSFNYNT